MSAVSECLVVECITNLKEEERQKRVRVETATSQSDGGWELFQVWIFGGRLEISAQKLHYPTKIFGGEHELCSVAVVELKSITASISGFFNWRSGGTNRALWSGLCGPTQWPYMYPSRYLPELPCTLHQMQGTSRGPRRYRNLLLHSEWYNFVYLGFQSRGTHQTTAFWIGIRIGDWQYHPEKACSTQVPQHSSDGFCITTAQIKNIFVGNCKTVVMGFASLWPK
jgi:hypothetical protein